MSLTLTEALKSFLVNSKLTFKVNLLLRPNFDTIQYWLSYYLREHSKSLYSQASWWFDEIPKTRFPLLAHSYQSKVYLFTWGNRASYFPFTQAQQAVFLCDRHQVESFSLWFLVILWALKFLDFKGGWQWCTHLWIFLDPFWLAELTTTGCAFERWFRGIEWCSENCGPSGGKASKVRSRGLQVSRETSQVAPTPQILYDGYTPQSWDE